MRVLLITIVSVLFSLPMYGQLFGRQRNKDCDVPEYSEDLSDEITTYQEFSLDSLTVEEPEEEASESDAEPLVSDSARVDSVLNVQKEYQKKGMVPGYRIQIWSGQNHVYMENNVSNYHANFDHLELTLYDNYDSGFFKVKVGDFSEAEHLDAYRALLQIKEIFPDALLVPSTVYL